ncbi:hypothetical protein N9Y81_03885 [Akkermansiaceae bacterium]|nr:hypothetical protein [Akkermansiaceae bacterium]
MPQLILLLLAVSPFLKAADLSDVTFDTSGGTVTITACSGGAVGELIIPELI